MSKATVATLEAQLSAIEARITPTMQALIARVEVLEAQLKAQPSKAAKPKVTHTHEFVGTYTECSAFCKQNLEHQPSPERIDDTTFGVFFRK